MFIILFGKADGKETTQVNLKELKSSCIHKYECMYVTTDQVCISHTFGFLWGNIQ